MYTLFIGGGPGEATARLGGTKDGTGGVDVAGGVGEAAVAQGLLLGLEALGGVGALPPSLINRLKGLVLFSAAGGAGGGAGAGGGVGEGVLSML